MNRWPIDTAQGQIVAVLTGALLATIGLVFALLILLRPPSPVFPLGPWDTTPEVMAVLRALRAATAPARPAIVGAVSSPLVALRLTAFPGCHGVQGGLKADHLRRIIRDALRDPGLRIAVTDCRDPADHPTFIEASFPLDGVPLYLQIPTRNSHPPIVLATLPLVVSLLFLLLSIVALTVWTLWRINRPLHRLAATVEQFGLDVSVSPVSEQGPREIRQLAQAFNRMQQRIARFVEERQTMLIAVSHDLRTPLTRLRLRVELDEAPATGQHLLRDIDLMHHMVNGALAFLGNGEAEEAVEEVDLGALVECLCAGFAEAGSEVQFIGSFGAICRCRPVAITRAVSNLIENGCRYGTHVVADVWQDRQTATIEIRDDGPGIPPEMRSMAVLPFARLDPSRRRDGGLGLGLAIVQEIVQRHGGQLVLLDAEPAGLTARIRLPLPLMGAVTHRA